MQESLFLLLAQTKNLLFQAPLSVSGAMIWGVVLYLVSFPIFFRKKELPQNFCMAMIFLYTAVILQSRQCLIAPNLYHLTAKSATLAAGAVEWNPFLIFPFGPSDAWTTLSLDFLMLMPIGFLVPFTNYRIRLGKVLTLSFIYGIGLEVLQLACNVLSNNAARSVGTGEAILSAAGCLSGYLIFLLFKKIPVPKHKARHYARTRQAL